MAVPAQILVAANGSPLLRNSIFQLSHSVADNGQICAFLFKDKTFLLSALFNGVVLMIGANLN